MYMAVEEVSGIHPPLITFEGKSFSFTPDLPRDNLKPAHPREGAEEAMWLSC